MSGAGESPLPVDARLSGEPEWIAGRDVFTTSARHGWDESGHDARRLCKSNVDSHLAPVFVFPDSRAASGERVRR